jgi:hypothetical protein
LAFGSFVSGTAGYISVYVEYQEFFESYASISEGAIYAFDQFKLKILLKKLIRVYIW